MKFIPVIIILALAASCALAQPRGTGELPRRESATIYDAQGRYQGRMFDGRVFNPQGEFQGRVRDGKIFDAKGNFVGRIRQGRPGGQNGTR